MSEKRDNLRHSRIGPLSACLLPGLFMMACLAGGEPTLSGVREMPAEGLQKTEFLDARESVVRVYAARAARWRGRFAVHTWIAARRASDPLFTVYEVMGWGKERRGSTVRISHRAPDSEWYGNEARLVAEIRGEVADRAVLRLEGVVSSYPYRDEYVLWPGPNSNTFTAYVVRSIPELRASLPATAIGKDFMGWKVYADSPSGTGWQVSLYGILGFILSSSEGLEINVLGMVFGLDFEKSRLKVPFLDAIPVGRTDPS